MNDATELSHRKCAAFIQGSSCFWYALDNNCCNDPFKRTVTQKVRYIYPKCSAVINTHFYIHSNGFTNGIFFKIEYLPMTVQHAAGSLTLFFLNQAETLKRSQQKLAGGWKMTLQELYLTGTVERWQFCTL